MAAGARLLTCLGTIGALVLTPAVASATPTPAPASAPDVLAAATQQALDEAAARTAEQGVTTYAVVLNRATGRSVATTDNATTAVASESLVKLLIAAWYLVDAQGAPSTELVDTLDEMIATSDDQIASALFAEGQVTAMAERYGLTDTTEPADGRWGSTAVTAADLARFLWLASRDPLVGPWLLDAMAGTTAVAADGWDQVYGVEALSDVVGAKQGWGSDNWHSGEPNAVHSIGLTDDLVVVDLQTGVEGTYWTQSSLSTDTVSAVVAAARTPDRFAGVLESVGSTGGVIHVGGWVADTTALDRSAPIRVTATRATGTAVFAPVTGSSAASRPRADVVTGTGLSGAHGFDYDLGITEPGMYEVCVTVRSAAGDKAIALVGCRTVAVAAPLPVADSDDELFGGTAAR